MELRRRLHLLILSFAAAAAVPGAAAAKVLLTQEQALAVAFPSGAKVERRTAYLTDAQLDAASRDAGAPVASKVWTYYVGASSSGALGTAYFDAHKVRTMNEALMIVVAPDATIRSVEVLAFAEPDEYMAPRGWLDRLRGRRLDDELMLRRGLRNVTGASITSDVVTRAVRRVLAVHRVLNPAR
ncbi:MAG: FMN-binding protein [Elusimicrobia bacterium]|nr:FMN-binding protein [Elusimicrobiota bacterium]